ncbi:MAG: outer membrane lipoprotein carrier protein LolA [Deltaproteobacteria bacterium]|nr:outer membrane lipoprotein carrier protein LolA [Nannocystaceae bacterium]
MAMVFGLAATWLASADQGEPPVAAAPVAASTITREELLVLLRGVPGVHAHYREVQHIALLAAPLESSGTLHFAPPTRLAKRQRAPSAAAMVVDQRRLRFADAFGRDEIDLGANPAVALFVDSFVDVLAGDDESLARTWAIGFTGGADGDPRAWVLALRPRVAPADRLVERIMLRGRDELVQRIEVHELGGDRTITTLSEVDARHRYDAAETARVFAITLP